MAKFHICLFTLMLLLLISCSTVAGISSGLLSKVKDGDCVVGVRTFLIMFVWKHKFSNETLTKLITAKDNDSRRKYLVENLQERGLTIGTIRDYTPFLSNYFKYSNLSLSHGLSNSILSSSYFSIYPQVDMCQRRDYFTRYDAFLLDPYDFAYYVRFYRDLGMTSGMFMNSDDFVAVPLIPFEVYTQTTRNQVSSLFDLNVASCDAKPDISDAQFLRRLTGYANFSQQDVEIIGNVTGKSQIYGNWTLVNNFLNMEMTELTINETWQELLPSTCYMCSTDGCYGENFRPDLDLFFIPQLVIIVIYFLLLFGLKIYKKPSMKRRIGIPYTPILILVVMITFAGVSRTCVGVWYSACLFCLFWWILIYISTIIRFYYLRNLYALIVMFPNREKMLKMLASQKVGILMTVMLTFVISQILNLVSVYFFVNEDKAATDFYRPIIGIIILLSLWVFGGCCFLLDLFLQRKTIRQGGIRKFFFFDDPFYLRIDLISTILPVIIAILTGIEATSNEVVDGLAGVSNTLLCFSFVQISGGNVLMIEIFKRVKRRKESSQLTWDQELTNTDLLQILKEYCEKEFSSENYEFYIKLKSLQNRKFIKLKELQKIEAEFIRNYSKYEVNIPSSCKKTFYELLNKCQEETQLEFQLIWDCVAPELLLNLQDTFSRLQDTSIYAKWLSVQSLKENNNV
ncbi:hypothetical protein NAEGRDRAFT_73295 [Naegleria gruberi]|uniref:RGS domain-containing protein n=1 Tax=Naegleria gruberi TaxID=5762 RepID=D2VW88_NAEGR|nr:uncharacterized protein NAEGRDRAFT_73295 [Naegleria gruberi]EFC38972.1 hypothetical protein NAEGRDRAFT_73295 [Naegleria gruberi]|eukprot:XP_002671716.1 hypothetical protein NAEGRDRAFT_73295 [Naegleria gruberi strain NEG-M]